MKVGSGDQLRQTMQDSLYLQFGLSDFPGPESFDVGAQFSELDVLVAPVGPQLMQLVVASAAGPRQWLPISRIGCFSQNLLRRTISQHSQ